MYHPEASEWGKAWERVLSVQGRGKAGRGRESKTGSVLEAEEASDGNDPDGRKGGMPKKEHRRNDRDKKGRSAPHCRAKRNP